MKVTVEWDLKKTGQKIERRLDNSQKFIDFQIIKDSNFYCPEDVGTLQDSALLASDIGSGVLEWNTPYAQPMYYGEGFNFSKDKNPNAQAKWFEAAKAAKKKEWERIANAKYNS